MPSIPFINPATFRKRQQTTTPIVPKRHTSQCAVCTSEYKEAVEAMYLKEYKNCREIAEEFGFSDDSVWKHVNYFGLNTKRVENTSAIYRQIAAVGLEQMETGIKVKLKDGTLSTVDIVVSPDTTLRALERLDKLTGAEQEPQKNQKDREIAARRIETLISNTIKMLEEKGIFIGVSSEQEKRTEAIKLLREYEPELMELYSE
jgi:hypothetical protein